ncbi:Pimeloyl-ACP methyl ester carboxylesterase [Reichenbachiella agariperforans]|uniref:Pimeloyl-ACP methyl ester carboxylesterase n=1 Tax=Reichenbachiella agariperforans TaxID=156994 RepID=A0A1M6LNQ9_REIAG|nr:alpha/beta fold hydrolase [Reichenbachiella agariperforans]SHJ72841.1 Pimeloyl-ACP methyl ester carboxylesterase [Reichenbachiella agariperforans]
MKKIIQIYFQFISILSPSWAARQAFSMFQIPMNKKIRQKELPFFETSHGFKVPWHLEKIQCYELGPKDGSLIFCVHGWESNAACFSAIAHRLADNGHRVILFNLPAHGFSKLKRANLKICAEAFLAVIAYMNPKEPFSVVAHSFGSAVSSYALSKTTYTVDHLIFLTTPDQIREVFQEFADFVRLSQAAFLKTLAIAEELLDESIDQVRVSTIGKKLNYQNLLIIHDTKDKVISIEKAQIVQQHWKKSRLIEIEGTGHYRMLWNPEVIQKVSEQIGILASSV